MNIRKRYSEFDDLRRRLVLTFPNFEAAVPALPPKSVLKRFHPRFLEKRRAVMEGWARFGHFERPHLSQDGSTE